ncbi:hypothetical protein PMN64_00325 [Bradyrhizobium sp. UFLA01-814]|uniref:hypothetical protein n=1 Tax=Bradyrhizobium sp. UFLA01-814 TaxID=3023480 RepID=UPI00398B8BE5
MATWTFIPLDYVRQEGSDVFVTSTSPFSVESLGKTSPAENSERQAYFEGLLRSIAWHLGSEHVPVFLNFNGENRRMDKGCVGHAVAAGVLQPPRNGPDGYVASVTLVTKSGSVSEAGASDVSRFKQSYRAYVLSKFKDFELTVQEGNDKEYYFKGRDFPPHMRLKHSFTSSAVTLVCEGPWKSIARTALTNNIPGSLSIDVHKGTLHLSTKVSPIDFRKPVEDQTGIIDEVMEAARRLLPYAIAVQEAARIDQSSRSSPRLED